MIPEILERYASPEELRRIGVLVAGSSVALGLLFTFWLIILPQIRSGSRPEAFAPSMAGELTSGWLDPLEYPPSPARVIPAAGTKDVLEPAPAALERGRALYAADCVPCHGPRGEGNGPAALGLDPPARDFTRAKDWLNGYDLAGIFKTLGEGISGSAMPPFLDLPAKDRLAVARVVESFARFRRPPESPERLRELRRLLSLEPRVVPARIPVSMAMARLERESRPPPPLSLATELLRGVVRDPARAAAFLGGVRGWRTDLRVLAGAVTGGAPANGFDVRAAELDRDGWARLQRDLAAGAVPLPAAPGAHEAPGAAGRRRRG